MESRHLVEVGCLVWEGSGQRRGEEEGSGEGRGGVVRGEERSGQGRGEECSGEERGGGVRRGVKRSGQGRGEEWSGEGRGGEEWSGEKREVVRGGDDGASLMGKLFYKYILIPVFSLYMFADP